MMYKDEEKGIFNTKELQYCPQSVSLCITVKVGRGRENERGKQQYLVGYILVDLPAKILLMPPKFR